LNVVQVLKALGVSSISASGRRPSRLDAAKAFGADIVIDAAKEDTVKALMEATGNMGVNTVFECVGLQTTFDQSVALARGGGKIMLVGVYEEPLTWNPQSVIAKNLSLIGCLGGNFPASIELLRSGKVSAKPLITHRFPLEQADEAFKVQLQDPGAIKVMIRP
jgi:alcohol dehydrogenase